jgi:CRP/FNR family transcriptional regulator, transcriptional activator FtrB
MLDGPAVAMLREHPLFSDLSEEALQPLRPVSLLQRFPAGVTLFHQGDQAEILYLLLGGMAKAFVSENNIRTVLAIRDAPAVFPLTPVVLDGTCLMTVQTLAPSRLALVPGSMVRNLMREHAAFAAAVSRELASDFSIMIGELTRQKVRTTAERLAIWVLSQPADGSGGSVTIPFSKLNLAELIGTSAEHLSRAFATLASYGVSVRGRQVLLGDRAALESFAKHQRESAGVSSPTDR